MPFSGSVGLPLGRQLIEAVALSLESELLSSLGHLGGTHRAELWPELAPSTPHPSPPGVIETGPLEKGLLALR